MGGREEGRVTVGGFRAIVRESNERIVYCSLMASEDDVIAALRRLVEKPARRIEELGLPRRQDAGRCSPMYKHSELLRTSDLRMPSWQDRGVVPVVVG